MRVSREYRRVGEPTRVFQHEGRHKGLQLWLVSRELATQVGFTLFPFSSFYHFPFFALCVFISIVKIC